MAQMVINNALPNNHLVKLPKTMEELKECFPERHKDVNNHTQMQEVVMKYSGRALELGRPLDSAMIFMYGKSNSGKSSTIKKLFGDPNLCMGNGSNPKSKHICVVSKELNFTSQTAAILGKICFVDTPEIADKENNDGVSFDIIRKFKETYAKFESRNSYLSDDWLSVRDTIFPNIILFVMSVTDHQVDGITSQLAMYLKSLKSLEMIVDFKYNNLIVVLTHAMSMGTSEKRFKETLSQKTQSITNQFSKHINLSTVKVVPIENEPENFDLIKENGFYKLPNGQSSHLNLIYAMQKCLKQNQDELGHVLISHYFSNDCLEKGNKAVVSNFHFDIKDVEPKQVSSEQVLAGFVSPEENESVHSNFHSLGRGFCPVTEKLKPGSPFLSNGVGFKSVMIENSKFSFPKYVDVFLGRCTKYNSLNFFDEVTYKNYIKHKYCSDIDIKLGVQGSANAALLKSENADTQFACVSVTNEIQVAKLVMKDPCEIKRNSSFLKEMNSFTDEYNHTQYRTFFSKYGTHFISEEAIGGILQLKYTALKCHENQETVKGIDAHISAIFKILCSGGAQASYCKELKQLDQLGVSVKELLCEGGTPPLIISPENPNTEEIKEWLHSVASRPVALPRSIEAIPYYMLEYGRKRENLRKATEEYINGEFTSSCELDSPNEHANGDSLNGASLNKRRALFAAGMVITGIIAYPIALPVAAAVGGGPFGVAAGISVCTSFTVASSVVVRYAENKFQQYFQKPPQNQ